MSDDIPEVRATAALQRVATLGARRTALVAETAQVTAELREACIEAARAQASRKRLRELSGVSHAYLYDWLRDAGVDMKPRRPRKKP